VPEKSETVQRRLVYGEYWMHESFTVLDATLAEGLSSEIEAIEACATVGQARALEPALKFTWLPGNDFEDDDGEPLPDDAPYDWSQTVAAQDGDWPPMPDQYALERLPSELLNALITRAGAEVHHTVLNGSYFAIPLEREADMVDALRSAGFEVRRDDDLVASIGLPQ
jgi:hypothetical protein